MFSSTNTKCQRSLQTPLTPLEVYNHGSIPLAMLLLDPNDQILVQPNIEARRKPAPHLGGKPVSQPHQAKRQPQTLLITPHHFS